MQEGAPPPRLRCQRTRCGCSPLDGPASELHRAQVSRKHTSRAQEGRLQGCPGSTKPECPVCSSAGLCEEVSRLRGAVSLQSNRKLWTCSGGTELLARVHLKQENSRLAPGRASFPSCGVSLAPSTDKS